jgi:hypothetical protein
MRLRPRIVVATAKASPENSRISSLKLWDEPWWGSERISNFDGNMLHQTDWSYNCIAEALADAIVEAVDGGGRQFKG